MNNKRIRAFNQLSEKPVYTQMNSPLGEITVFGSSKGLHCILWDIQRFNDKHGDVLNLFTSQPHHPILEKTTQQLHEYFAGERKSFDIPLVMDGTDFQQQAWQQLQHIPYGQTISYGQQAQRLGDKNKARAIGLANGANPISIIIPCHRVIGSNGDLTGFGGGLDKKAYLLELEQKHISS